MMDFYFYSTTSFPPTPPADVKTIAEVSGDNSKKLVKTGLFQGTQNAMPLKT